MAEGNLVEIGFAGKTQCGKTTTIRTLMRKAVGVVGDSPNMTQQVAKYRSSSEGNPQNYKYTGIQAIFVDCPGFQMASLSRHFIDDLKGLIKMDKKAKYDARAIEGLREVDLVIYIGNLEDVPNDDYMNEIELIKSLNKPCVVLLNKFRERSVLGNKEDVINRRKQWETKIGEFCNFPVMNFDAHWYSPSSTNELYRLIKKSLPEHRRILFDEGLDNFEKEQNRIRTKVASAFVDLITECRKTVKVKEGEGDVDYDTGEEAVKNKLRQQVKKATEQFFSEISSIYKLSASLNSDDKFECYQYSETKLWDIIVNSATVAGGGAALGAAAGTAIGALVGFLGGAGIGAGPTALAGFQIGAAILGTLGGGSGALMEINTRHQGNVSEEYLKNILDRSIGVTYAMACHGFGLGAKLRDEDIADMIRKAKNLRSKHYPNIWLIDYSPEEILELAQSLLKYMGETCSEGA